MFYLSFFFLVFLSLAMMDNLTHGGSNIIYFLISQSSTLRRISLHRKNCDGCIMLLSNACKIGQHRCGDLLQYYYTWSEPLSLVIFIWFTFILFLCANEIIFFLLGSNQRTRHIHQKKKKRIQNYKHYKIICDKTNFLFQLSFKLLFSSLRCLIYDRLFLSCSRAFFAAS